MASATSFQGSVPTNYEKYLGPLLFEPYAIDLVKRLNGFPWPLLELACGTGRVTNHIASILPPGETFMATDLNADMISVAKSKVVNTNIKWQVADAHSLPFNDGYFKTVVCQFGIMFFTDKLKALKEIHRVLMKGGKFLFNTWDVLERNDAAALMVSVLHDIMGDDTPDFMERGPHSFADPVIIKQLLTSAGFSEIKIEIVTKSNKVKHAEDIVTGFVDGSPLASYLDKIDISMKEKLKEKFHKSFINKYGSEDVAIPMQALIIEAMS
jgi:SAM-dependent methyltransferase